MLSIKRRYAAFFALLVLVFSSIASLGCEDPPLPLRGMYLQSDVIVIGRIGKPGKWMAGAREGEGDTQYQIFNRSVSVTVEKVLKGDAPGKLEIGEENYHYFGDVSAGNGGIKPAAQPEYESELTKDTGRRFFFLKKNEQGVYTEVYINRDFSPKGKDFDIYVSRLTELNEMYHNGEPAKEKIVEWLVSMAENSVTRFEGAYELRNSLYGLKYEADEAARNADHSHSLKEALAEQEATENDEPKLADDTEHAEEAGEDEYPQYGEAAFARLLTEEQKSRLVKAFFTVKFDYEPKKYDDPGMEGTYVSVLNEGDSHLVDAVVLLNDRRVINRIMAEMPNLARHESYTAANLLDIISGQLKNEKFTKLVEKFSEVAYGGEDEMIDSKASAYDAESLEGTDEEKAAQLANLPNKTYGARRAELIGRISASLNQQTAKK